MAKLRRRARRPMRSNAHRLRGCPLTRNLSGWCFGYCAPHDGKGLCGRAAPHAIVGRTQQAIIRHRLATSAVEPE